MKNFFNAEEKAKHIVIMGTQNAAEKLSGSKAITPGEKMALRKIVEWIDKFNDSVFERYGDPYKRKILNTMKINKIDLVSKYGKERECISECASEDLEPAIKDLQMWKCCDCERTCNFQDCAVYAISVACDMEGNEKDGGCPFKW